MRILPLLLAACGVRAPVGPADTELLVVLRGVASPALAACGGEVPTPTLDALVASGASLSCAAVAASPKPSVALKALLEGRPPALPEALLPKRRTLAAQAAAAGRRTVIVSADPLPQGVREAFALSEVGAEPTTLRGGGAVEVLASVLGQIEPDRPALIVVVLGEAAPPWPPLQASAGTPAQGWLPLAHDDGTPSELLARYRTGSLAIDEEDRFLRRVAAGARAGLAAADAQLGAVLATVEAARGPVVRLVVTSDAGVHHGALGLVGEDALPRDGVARVPFLVRGGSFAVPEVPFPASLAWDAIQGLATPSPLPPAVSGSRGGDDVGPAVDLWRADGTKLVWRDGATGLVDPRQDPLEASLAEAPAGPDRATLEALVMAVTATR